MLDFGDTVEIISKRSNELCIGTIYKKLFCVGINGNYMVTSTMMPKDAQPFQTPPLWVRYGVDVNDDETFLDKCSVEDVVLLAKKGSFAEKAFYLAEKAHKGQTFKDKPFINHLVEVEQFVRMENDSDEVLAIAYLHDILEKTEITVNDLCEIFPQKIVDTVKLLDPNEHESYCNYLTKVRGNDLARMVKHSCVGSSAPRPSEYAYSPEFTKKFKEHNKILGFLQKW